jgi:hypothetical protein
MGSGHHFRRLLPVVQTVLAPLFGGLGLWQRNEILSYSFFGWNSTAAFHVWPWPYKFAVVSNMPAFLAGSLVWWPIGVVWPAASEAVANARLLVLVPILWYRVGSRLDRRWGMTDKTPWIALATFTFVCLVGALIRIGYVGYIPYGIVVWLTTAFALWRIAKPALNHALDLNSRPPSPYSS